MQYNKIDIYHSTSDHIHYIWSQIGYCTMLASNLWSIQCMVFDDHMYLLHNTCHLLINITHSF